MSRKRSRDAEGRANNPIWQDWGVSGRGRRVFQILENRRHVRRRAAARNSVSREVRRETAADSYRLDRSGEATAIVRFKKDAAQCSLAIGYLGALAGHLPDEAANRRLLLEANDGIIIAAHPGIGLIRRAAGQDLRVGGWNMRVRPQHGRDSAIREMRP